VEEDPGETGRRAVLNLGHTFGHALELLSDYSLPHGHAVSIGMVIAARVARMMGLCQPELEERLAALLARLGLPVTWTGLKPEEVLAAMAHDKKRRGGRLRFVLPVRLGHVVIRDDVPREVILQALHQAQAI
jgi:3-dehydroquinate synthetase